MIEIISDNENFESIEDVGKIEFNRDDIITAIKEDFRETAERLQSEGLISATQNRRFLSLIHETMAPGFMGNVDVELETLPAVLGPEIVRLKVLSGAGNNLRGKYKFDHTDPAGLMGELGTLVVNTSGAQAVAVRVISKLQGEDFFCNLEKYLKDHYLQRLINMPVETLALFDESLAAGIYADRFPYISSDVFMERGVMGLSDDAITARREYFDVYSLSLRYPEILKKLGAARLAQRFNEHKISTTFSTQIVSALRAFGSVPPDETQVGIIDNIMNEPEVVAELSRPHSPYANYLPAILKNPELLVTLVERTRLASSSFFTAMLARVDQQFHDNNILHSIGETARRYNAAPEFEEDLTEQGILALLSRIYKESELYVSSPAVEAFLDDTVGIYLVRGNDDEALESILLHGGYAQEVVPYIPWHPNAESGFLNTLRFEDIRPTNLISATLNHGTLDFYGGGESILIFKPSAETLSRLLNTKTTIGTADNNRPVDLIKIGIPSTELAAMIIARPKRQTDMIDVAIGVERYVPIYDTNGALLFTKSRFDEALAGKRFQSVDEFISNPPVEHLGNIADTHGYGTLLDHTRRVEAGIGHFINNGEPNLYMLSRIAAICHDIGKHEEGVGEQGDRNTAATAPILAQIRGLGVRDKRIILNAIKADEDVGGILRLLPEDATKEQVRKSRDSLLGLFPDEDSLRVGLDVYYADVLGIDQNGAALKLFAVEEKLKMLGFFANEIGDRQEEE